MSEEQVIIVAGGKGLRMGTEIPKQFLLLNGLPILAHTIERFHQYNPEIRIIVVLPEEQISRWHQLCEQAKFNIPHQIVSGGETRFHSVKNGLTQTSSDGIIAIHDGVRPLTPVSVIQEAFSLAKEKGSAIPTIPSVDSIRQLSQNEKSQAVDRTTIRMVQTPQVFQAQWIHSAYEQPFSEQFTDDASVLETAGYPIHLCQGANSNIKITNPSDLYLAEYILSHE